MIFIFSLGKNDTLAYAVLRYALGVGPSVYYGTGSGPLSKMSGNLVRAQALSLAHSDAGLFGVYVASQGYNAKEVCGFLYEEVLSWQCCQFLFLSRNKFIIF